MKKQLHALVLPLLLVLVAGCQVQPADSSVALSRLTGDYWQIWTMQADGSKTRQTTSSPSDKRYPVWAKDGRTIFYRTNNSELFSVAPDEGQEERILASLGLSSGAVPSPDGSRLVVARLRTEPKDTGNLLLTTLEGGNRKVLTRDRGLQYDPAWSPDGKQIAYVSSHGYRTAELYVIDSDGRNKRRLTNNKVREVLPAFSPDGKTIAYVSEATGDYEIWLMDTDGGNCRQLTNSVGMDTRPCWSPDGSKIMFTSSRSGKFQIWVMNSDGSNPQQSTTGLPAMDPAWRKQQSK